MLHNPLFRSPPNEPKSSESCRQFSTKGPGKEKEERKESCQSGGRLSTLHSVGARRVGCVLTTEFQDDLGSDKSYAIVQKRNLGSNWVNLKIKTNKYSSSQESPRPIRQSLSKPNHELSFFFHA